MTNRVKQMIPAPTRAWLRRQQRAGEKKMLRFDRVADWSVLRSVQPYRTESGRRRGQCVDRYYIEKFLAANQEAIRGRVAEVCDSEYTVKFGAGRVEQSDILDVNEQNARRTITLDLAQPEHAPDSLFDCIIATQVLLFIRDYAAVIRSFRKMLKPGGALLLTVPGISPLITGNLIAGSGDDWWRFTGRSAQYEFASVFGEEQVQVQTYGNVLTATAFLYGLVSQELTAEELEYHDPGIEMLIGVRATRSTFY